MSTTILCNTLFYFFGLELMVHDLQRLSHFGIRPLSLVELLFCDSDSSFIISFYIVVSVVLFYTARAQSTRAWAAYKVQQAATKRARGAMEYNLRRSLALKAEELAQVKLERDSVKRENANLRTVNHNKRTLIVQIQHTANTEHAGRVQAENEARNLRSQLERQGAELEHSHATVRTLQHKIVNLTEEAEAREVVHQAERTGDAALYELQQAELVDTQDKLRASDAEVEHFKAVAEDAQQSARDATTRAANSKEQLRVVAAGAADLSSRAEKAEVGEREAKLTISALKEDVQAGCEREGILKGEIVHLKSEVRGLRAKVATKEGTIIQIQSDHAEYQTCVESMVNSYETVHECFQAKIATQDGANQELQRENDAMRAHYQGTPVDGQTDKSPLIPPFAFVSLAESDEDSDTPSLTFCDSPVAALDSIDDGPKNFADTFVPTQHSTPASARLYTLTTSTSAEIVTSDAGTALIVTSSSTLSMAAHIVPTRRLTPKRPRSSQRSRSTTSGFLEKLEFRSMELSLCPALTQKTSAVRPCDAPDLFSPTYRRYVTRRPKTARARFVEFLRACPEERHLYRPVL
ncbi:unnamed protein product [Peniophora sp. CBMAI 1063]|nr:unnamed protein product [Peniophora sp. CBMAI 1063]